MGLLTREKNVIAATHLLRLVDSFINTVNDANTIRYDTVYLTCSKKLTDSHLSLTHGMNKKCKRKKSKNKLMSVISSVQSHDHEGSPVGKEEKLRWEGFVEKVSFEPGVKE